MSTASVNVRCAWAGFSSAEQIRARLQKLNTADEIQPTTINDAIKLQTKVFLNILTLGAMLFLVSLIIDLLRIYSTMRNRKVAPRAATTRRQNFHRQFSLALAWSACACTLAAALANTQAVKALEISSNGVVTRGRNSLGIHWAMTALLFLFCTGLTMLRRTKSGIASTESAFPNFNDAQPMVSGAAPMGVVTL